MMAGAHACVVLAIDPGRISGWAVFVDGEYTASGVAKRHQDRLEAATMAVVAAEQWHLPLVVVGEKWTPGGKFAGARTMAGLGASWGLWTAVLEEAEIPKARMIRVHTQTWRARVLGGGWGVRTAEWDRRARMRASAVVGSDVWDDNEADAICIGLWARLAPEVEAKLPKKRRAQG